MDGEVDVVGSSHLSGSKLVSPKEGLHGDITTHTLPAIPRLITSGINKFTAESPADTGC